MACEDAPCEGQGDARIVGEEGRAAGRKGRRVDKGSEARSVPHAGSKLEGFARISQSRAHDAKGERCSPVKPCIISSRSCAPGRKMEIER